jgi:small-conductance mechanosensitive channel
MLEEYIANPYLRAGGVLVGIFVILKILIWTLTKIIPLFTSKTETELDDVILQKASRPLTILAFLLGIRFAIGEIGLGESWVENLEGVVMTFMILFGGVLVYYVLDSILSIGYRDFGHRVKKVNESLMQFFRSIFKILVMAAVFLAVLSSWGFEIAPILAGLGVAGIAIALAIKPTLANVFGGISMLLDRSINVGDWVELADGTSGYVSQVNLRSTKIRTFNNKLVIVPNGWLSESNIKNVALPSKETRVVIPFGVAYGSDVDKVKRIVLKEIRKVGSFYDKQDPAVRFLEMADSSLNFKAYFYVKDFNDVANAMDEANSLIYKALNKAGVEIPFPQVDVNLRK